MSVIIKGFNKPASCLSCPFNHSDCWCAITKGGIDRDDYSCDLPCPIESLPKGYGNLIDVSKLEPDRDYGDGIYGAVSCQQLLDATIIIEADKECENECR